MNEEYAPSPNRGSDEGDFTETSELFLENKEAVLSEKIVDRNISLPLRLIEYSDTLSKSSNNSSDSERSLEFNFTGSQFFKNIRTCTRAQGQIKGSIATNAIILRSCVTNKQNSENKSSVIGVNLEVGTEAMNTRGKKKNQLEEAKPSPQKKTAQGRRKSLQQSESTTPQENTTLTPTKQSRKKALPQNDTSQSQNSSLVQDKTCKEMNVTPKAQRRRISLQAVEASISKKQPSPVDEKSNAAEMCVLQNQIEPTTPQSSKTSKQPPKNYSLRLRGRTRNSSSGDEPPVENETMSKLDLDTKRGRGRPKKPKIGALIVDKVNHKELENEKTEEQCKTKQCSEEKYAELEKMAESCPSKVDMVDCANITQSAVENDFTDSLLSLKHTGDCAVAKNNLECADDGVLGGKVLVENDSDIAIGAEDVMIENRESVAVNDDDCMENITVEHNDNLGLCSNDDELSDEIGESLSKPFQINNVENHAVDVTVPCQIINEEINKKNCKLAPELEDLPVTDDHPFCALGVPPEIEDSCCISSTVCDVLEQENQPATQDEKKNANSELPCENIVKKIQLNETTEMELVQESLLIENLKPMENTEMEIVQENFKPMENTEVELVQESLVENTEPMKVNIGLPKKYETELLTSQCNTEIAEQCTSNGDVSSKELLFVEKSNDSHQSENSILKVVNDIVAENTANEKSVSLSEERNEFQEPVKNIDITLENTEKSCDEIFLNLDGEKLVQHNILVNEEKIDKLTEKKDNDVFDNTVHEVARTTEDLSSLGSTDCKLVNKRECPSSESDVKLDEKLSGKRPRENMIKKDKRKDEILDGKDIEKYNSRKNSKGLKSGDETNDSSKSESAVEDSDNSSESASSRRRSSRIQVIQEKRVKEVEQRKKEQIQKLKEKSLSETQDNTIEKSNQSDSPSIDSNLSVDTSKEASPHREMSSPAVKLRTDMESPGIPTHLSLDDGGSPRLPEKVKSRWRRSSELELQTPSEPDSRTSPNTNLETITESPNQEADTEEETLAPPIEFSPLPGMPPFEHISDNTYLSDRRKLS